MEDDADGLIGRQAAAQGPTRALVLDRTEPGVIVRSTVGTPIALVARMPDPLVGRLHVDLQDLGRENTTLRGHTGLRNRSRTFGYSPRMAAIKRESCRPAALDLERPGVAATLRETAVWAGAVMAEYLPEVVEHDEKTLAPVLPEWRFAPDEGHLWTSGVVNRDSPMPYHRDGSNFPTWSAMPVIRSGVRGGHLHLPEWDLTFPCSDGTALFWWGQKHVHGVTPLRMLSPAAYRFSVVYYALRGMKDCATWARESADGRRRRTEREDAIAERLVKGGTVKIAGVTVGRSLA